MWWWWRPQWAHYTIHWRRQWPCQWRDMLLTTRETHTNRNGRSGWWRFGALGALYTLSVSASWFGLSTALCRQQTTTQCHLHDNRECNTSCQRTPNTIRQKKTRAKTITANNQRTTADVVDDVFFLLPVARHDSVNCLSNHTKHTKTLGDHYRQC